MSSYWKPALHADPTSWLLDGTEPAVTAEALLVLEGRSRDDPMVRRFRKLAMTTDPIRTILSSQSPEGWWSKENPSGTYKKYQGSSWNLLFLAELRANPDHPQIIKSCRNFLDNNFVEGVGALSANGKPNGAMVCFNAHLVYALTRLGFESNPRLKSAINWIIKQQSDSGAFTCRVMDYSLVPDCVMTIPKVLKMATVIPTAKWSKEFQSMIDRAVGYMMSVNLYRYVPSRSQEWYQLIWGKPIAQVRELKKSFEMGPLGEKKGWLRFQFPLHYNSDLLEVLWTMARLGVKKTPEIEEGVNILLSLQTKQGTWVMKNSLNGKMWVNIEKKGKPSRWLTLKACEVLERYI
jgi:hypothetical protein